MRDVVMIVLECAFHGWSPGIGDPTVMGWVAVAAYLSAAAFAGVAGTRAAFPISSRRRERLFWLSLFLVLSFLAINKQLDLQSFLTALGRCLSRTQGWYDNRRDVQQDFVLALGGTRGGGRSRSDMVSSRHVPAQRPRSVRSRAACRIRADPRRRLSSRGIADRHPCPVGADEPRSGIVRTGADPDRRMACRAAERFIAGATADLPMRSRG